MATRIAYTLARVVLAYTGVGVLFALPFAAWGAGRLDPAARGADWGFRLVVVPGAVTLWPWLLVRWLQAAGRTDTPPQPGPH